MKEVATLKVRELQNPNFDFIRVHKIDAKVTRIFNTYGPYMLK